MAAAAIDRFMQANNHKCLKRFHINQATAFRDKFESQSHPKTGEPLSRSTVTTTLKALRDFTKWLADQPGYKARISYSDAQYFTPSLHDERIARARRPMYVPTVDQIHQVIANMPSATVIQRRDRALIAFTMLACPRDGAAASLRLKHVDLNARKVIQSGADMKTKFRKTFVTYFMPVSGEAEGVVAAWIDELKTDHGFGPEDPLFPKTKVGRGASGGFEVMGLDRGPWASTTKICEIFKDAFEAAGLPRVTPHAFRHTLALFGMEICKTPLELKAWSQNLGHSSAMTTIMSYGKISEVDQGALIAKIERTDQNGEREAAIAKIKEIAAAF
ncbi:MAG: site-specific integrase [Pseudomonadota bacterium]